MESDGSSPVLCPAPVHLGAALLVTEDVWRYAIYEAATCFFQRGLLSNTAVRSYLQRRGVDETQIRYWRLGYCHDDSLIQYLENCGFSVEEQIEAGLVGEWDGRRKVIFTSRVLFPIIDLNGMVCAFGGRRLQDTTNDRSPKYLNSPESIIYQKQEILYGLHQALPTIRSKRRVILTEGYMDVLPLHRAALTETVCCCGTAITEQQVYLLRMLGVPIYALFDGDTAGIEAGERFTRICGNLRAQGIVCRVPDRTDPGSIVAERGAAFLESLLATIT